MRGNRRAVGLAVLGCALSACGGDPGPPDADAGPPLDPAGGWVTTMTWTSASCGSSGSVPVSFVLAQLPGGVWHITPIDGATGYLVESEPTVTCSSTACFVDIVERVWEFPGTSDWDLRLILHPDGLIQGLGTVAYDDGLGGGGCTRRFDVDGMLTDTPCSPDRELCGTTAALECVAVQTDPASCGGCVTTPDGPGTGQTCANYETCSGGTCADRVQYSCSDFEGTTGDPLAGWTQQSGTFLVESGEVYTTATTPGAPGVITRDGVPASHVRVTADLTYGAGIADKQVGVVARWSGPNTYVFVALQDVGATGEFNRINLVEYPSGVPNGLGFQALGTDPAVMVDLEFGTITVRVDSDHDGIYEQVASHGLVTLTAGLVGVAGISGGAPARVADFCTGSL
jgi:hypothetical protein